MITLLITTSSFYNYFTPDPNFQIYGDMQPEQWTSQWQDVLRTEGVACEETTANGNS